jgi:hypothetical protein
MFSRLGFLELNNLARLSINHYIVADLQGANIHGFAQCSSPVSCKLGTS